jgi:hypothetical protein
LFDGFTPGKRAFLYSEAADAIRAVQAGSSRHDAMGLLPGMEQGMDGMAFIQACVTSSAAGAAWVTL